MQLDEFIRKRHARELGKLDVIKLKASTQKEIDEEYAKWPPNQAEIDHLEIIFDLANSYLGSLSDEEDESCRFQEEKERGYHQAYEEYDCIVLPKREPIRTRTKEKDYRYVERVGINTKEHNKLRRFIASNKDKNVNKLYSDFTRRIENFGSDKKYALKTFWNREVRDTYTYCRGEFIRPQVGEVGYPIDYANRCDLRWLIQYVMGVNNCIAEYDMPRVPVFSGQFIDYQLRTVQVDEDKSFFYRFKSYQRRIGENEYETVWNGHWEVHYKNVGWATIGWVDLPYSMPYSGRTASKKEIKKYKLKALGETLKPMPGTYDKG